MKLFVAGLFVALGAEGCAGPKSRGCGEGLAIPSKAFDLCQIACGAGDRVACFDAGYAKGFGTAVGMAKKAAEFRARCDAGEPGGCSALAFMYENGQGVEKNPAEIAKVRRKACELGSSADCAPPSKSP